jgi:hypothetical protein
MFGSKMPVVQRSKEVSRVWDAWKIHYIAWKAKIQNRKEHLRCFAYGPPGSGKTKFGVELIPLLISHGEQICASKMVTNEDKELLKMLSNAVFIHITFANGNELLNEEKENMDIQCSLIVRALRHLFGLTLMSISAFCRQFGARIKNWNIQTLLEVAVKYADKTQDPTEPRMVYIHLDEFNHLYDCDPKKVFKEAINILSRPLNTPPEGIFYTVLFTGTAYTKMLELSVSESNPLLEIPMKVLDFAGISLFRCHSLNRGKCEMNKR